MEAVNEEEGEMGYSVYSVSDTSVSEKLSEDEVFWESTLPDYKFASFYVGESSDEEIQEALDSKFLQQIRTVVKGIDDTSDVIGYINNQVTKQNALIDGYEHTFRQNL